MNNNLKKKLAVAGKNVIQTISKITDRKTNEEKIFTRYFQENFWGDPDSVSGEGSNLVQTAKIRKELPKLLQKYQVKSVMDIACGDFFWMNKIVLPDIEYVGGDVVSELIKFNNERYGQVGRRFIKLNILRDKIPRADLILCRDCFIHFSYVDISLALTNIVASGSKYLLTTSHIERTSNYDINMGEWHPLNLLAKPFSFPRPLQILTEGCTEGNGSDFADKSLVLWEIETLKIGINY